jgi:hypothetical protein
MLIGGFIIWLCAKIIATLWGIGTRLYNRYPHAGRLCVVPVACLLVIPVVEYIICIRLSPIAQALLHQAGVHYSPINALDHTLESIPPISILIYMTGLTLSATATFTILNTQGWWIPVAVAWPAGLAMVSFFPQYPGVAVAIAVTAAGFLVWNKIKGANKVMYIAAVSPSGDNGRNRLKSGDNGHIVTVKPLDPDKILSVLRRSVIGQDEALRIIANRLSVNTRKRHETPSPNVLRKPVAVFLAVGPTGVGKTETAKALAKAMESLADKRFGSLTFDMSEFYDKHTAARLVGSPPGYVGSDEPGQLTGPMRSNPFRVVLFDEIEKAHPSIMNTFLQIFDEGRLTDASKGFSVSFANAVVVLTSNLATEEIGEILEHTEDPIQRRRDVLDLLKESGIRPEILARINDIVPYKSLARQDYIDIVVHWADGLPRGRKPEDPRAFAEDLLDEAASLMPYGVREILRAAEERVYLQKVN